MDQKNIFLWTLEKDTIEKKILLELDLNQKKLIRLNLDALAYFPKKSFIRSDPDLLVINYFRLTTELSDEFNKVLKRESEKNPYLVRTITDISEVIHQVEISLATKDVFEKKINNNLAQDEEDKNEELKASACYSAESGIKFCLEKNKFLGTFCQNLIHEYGHHLDYLLNPKDFQHKTATMKEVMAILLREQFYGVAKYQSSLHSRAEGLLRLFEHSDFKGLDFADKWIYLSGMIDHKEGVDSFFDDFKFKPPKYSWTEYFFG